MKTYTKIFIYILLFAYFNYMVGCYTVDEISMEENFPESEIIAVKLSNGKIVEFINNSGKYEIAQVVIDGKTNNGKNVFISLDNVKEVRGNRPPAVSVNELSESKITEIINTDDILIKFNPDGGRYFPSDSLISGTSEQGYPLRIKLNYIKEVHTIQPETIPKSDLLGNENLKIYQLILKRGNEVITFDDNGAGYRKNIDIFSGITRDGKQVDINASEVVKVNVEDLNEVLTVATVVGILSGIILLILASKLGSESKSSKSTSCNSYSY